MNRTVRIVCAIALALVASNAHAHAAFKGAGAFYSGMLHPVTALEHLLPILAFGLLAGQQMVAQKTPWMILVFALAFAIGAACSGWVPTNVDVSRINFVSALVLGGIVLAAWSPPAPVVYALSLVFGLTHGTANGLEPGIDLSPILFDIGATTGVLFALAYVAFTTNAVLKRQIGWTTIAVRVAGSWIAAVGMLVLSSSFRHRI